MNWINIAENLGITLISFAIGVVLGAYVTITITNKVIESNQQILIEALNTPNTTITNDYEIKNKKGKIDLNSINDINEDSLNRKNDWIIFGTKKHRKK